LAKQIGPGRNAAQFPCEPEVTQLPARRARGTKINAGAAAVTSEQTMIAANLLFDNTTVLDNP